jgi:hypothetical protein
MKISTSKNISKFKDIFLKINIIKSYLVEQMAKLYQVNYH